MPSNEAPCVELGSAPGTPSMIVSPSVSEVSSASSPEPHQLRVTPLFRVLALPPPEPEQPPGQDELERRLPGYRRIVIPRELTLIELLRQANGVNSDEEVLSIRETTLRVVAERVGLRRLHVLTPRLRSLTLDGSAISSLRELGVGLRYMKVLSVNRCGLTCLDGIWGLGSLRELYAAGNRLHELHPLAALQKLHTLDLSDNPISQASRLWTLGVCNSLRRLSMQGTPAAEDPNYRTQVATALPMLVYLDDRPLHTDVSYSDSEEQNICDAMSSDSDEELCQDHDVEPGTSGLTSSKQKSENLLPENETESSGKVNGRGDCRSADVHQRLRRQRPATTEGASARPHTVLPPRPRTAHDLRPTRLIPHLHAFNTLLDNEWHSSGSELTSGGAVCGNLARALRRHRPSRSAFEPVASTSAENPHCSCNDVHSTPDDTEVEICTAKEIPRDSSVEEWARFREVTGLDFELDFNERPKDIDPNKVIEKLEQIEKETRERLHRESLKEFELAEEIALEWERKTTLHPLMEAEQDYLYNPDNNNLILNSELWRNVDDLDEAIDINDEVCHSSTTNNAK